jgi:hypothetical protein
MNRLKNRFAVITTTVLLSATTFLQQSCKEAENTDDYETEQEGGPQKSFYTGPKEDYPGQMFDRAMRKYSEHEYQKFAALFSLNGPYSKVLRDPKLNDAQKMNEFIGMLAEGNDGHIGDMKYPEDLVNTTIGEVLGEISTDQPLSLEEMKQKVSQSLEEKFSQIFSNFQYFVGDLNRVKEEWKAMDSATIANKIDAALNFGPYFSQYEPLKNEKTSIEKKYASNGISYEQAQEAWKTVENKINDLRQMVTEKLLKNAQFLETFYNEIGVTGYPGTDSTKMEITLPGGISFTKEKLLQGLERAITKYTHEYGQQRKIKLVQDAGAPGLNSF